jgi:RNA polymerase-binding transcription factor DksA
MAHSPEFIAEMKQRLEAEREMLAKELKTVAHEQAGDFTADFPDYGRNEEDNATEMADFVATAATTEATEARLKEIEAAIERIEAGTYGKTSEGELIPEERLRANPAATTIIKR